MFTAVANVVDGDATSWVAEWRGLAPRIQVIADESLKGGHKVSARNAYLRASVYYAAANVFVDGTDNADAQLTEIFAEHRKCFDLHVGLLDPPAIPSQFPTRTATSPATSSFRQMTVLPAQRSFSTTAAMPPAHFSGPDSDSRPWTVGTTP